MKATQANQLRGKRILFVLCGFDLGGAERQALHFARYLKNLGCDVRVWGHHHRYAGPELVIEHCKAAGIPWAVYKFRWPCSKVALLRDGWRMLRGLYRERPDVILSYTTWPNVGCGLTWRLSPAKAFIWGQRDVRLHADAVERFAYRRSSGVICNAAHEAEYLCHTLGKTRAPVHVVHNGIDLAPGQKTRIEWRRELGIGEDITVAAMVANFRLGKDHMNLLHAWRKVLRTIPKGQSRPRLLLAGAHQESYAGVYQLASDLDLLDTVIFPGQVKDVAGLLAASDIGVLATADEGLPNAILEYMASGLPVVATDVPGTREALGDDPQQPLCKPGDPDSLASRLQTLLHEADLRRRLGARNRQRASEEFSIGKMCETMAGIVGDLLKAVPART
jgi:glycosyltransferase involved in cell wall biosynthesis